MRSTTKDMTVGSPLKIIIGFAIPVMLGILFQQLYSVVDSMVIGKWIGTDAFAGVGSTGSISSLIIGFCNGIGAGCAIPVAQSFGAKDYSSLRRYIANSVWVSIALVSVITFVAALLCPTILDLMKTPEDVWEYAYEYILITFIGIPVLYAYNLLSAMIRALGDSKSPVFFLLIASFLNIIFDIFSVAVLNMGVNGPALATILAQLISVILCVIYMKKKFKILKFEKGEWRFESKKALKSLAIGVPMGLQTSIMSMGSIILQRSVNSLGTIEVASTATGQKVGALTGCPYEALGTTMATYAGQNTGVGDTKRINKGVSSAVIIGLVYWVIASIVLFAFGDTIALLYIDKTEVEVISNAHMYLMIHGFSYVLLTFLIIMRNVVQGMGYSSVAVGAGALEMIARAFLGIVAVPMFGYIAACFSATLAWFLADIFIIPAYFVSLKKVRKNYEKTHPQAETSNVISA